LSAFGWAGLAAGGRLDMVSRASRASRVGRIRWAPRRAAVRGCDRTLRSASCVMCQRCLSGASGVCRGWRRRPGLAAGPGRPGL